MSFWGKLRSFVLPDPRPSPHQRRFDELSNEIAEHAERVTDGARPYLESDDPFMAWAQDMVNRRALRDGTNGSS